MVASLRINNINSSVGTPLYYITNVANKFHHTFVRRSMFVPAKLKFGYYYFFSTRSIVGFYRIWPKFIIPTGTKYNIGTDLFRDVGKVLFNQPKMNACTGLLAEGHMRFGNIGTILMLILFAGILRVTDDFQKRVGYAIGIGTFVVEFFIMNDWLLLQQVLVGHQMIAFMLLIFYRKEKTNCLT